MPDFHADNDLEELDDTRLYCPDCGCAAEVLRLPRPGTWFSASGLAECFDCHRRFGIAVVNDPPEPPTQPSPWEWLIDAIARAGAEIMK